MAERYTYISYTGIFLLLAWTAVRMSEKGAQARTMAWLAIAVLTGYWAWTTKQIAVWRNSETLWTQIVAQYPTEKCFSYRGYHRYLEGKWVEALADFNAAYALNPNNDKLSTFGPFALKNRERLRKRSTLIRNTQQKLPGQRGCVVPARQLAEQP